MEQRRSEQPIEDQLSIVNPQQPNSCHPLKSISPLVAAHQITTISAAPPPACMLVRYWSAQIKPPSNELTMVGKEAVVRDF